MKVNIKLVNVNKLDIVKINNLLSPDLQPFNKKGKIKGISEDTLYVYMTYLSMAYHMNVLSNGYDTTMYILYKTKNSKGIIDGIRIKQFVWESLDSHNEWHEERNYKIISL